MHELKNPTVLLEEPAPKVQQLPGGTSAGVAAAARLSPLAWGNAVLSDADTAVCWETCAFKNRQRCSSESSLKSSLSARTILISVSEGKHRLGV